MQGIIYFLIIIINPATKASYISLFQLLQILLRKALWSHGQGERRRKDGDGNQRQGSQLLEVGARGCCFFPGLSKFIVALYSSVIQKKDLPL